MSMCRCDMCEEIIDSDLCEGCVCADCKADMDDMDLEDQLETLLEIIDGKQN